jgi:hypothetical protein
MFSNQLYWLSALPHLHLHLIRPLTGICCGKAVKRVGMLGVSVRKMKALSVKVETVALIGEGR